jgi:hypothetical protein
MQCCQGEEHPIMRQGDARSTQPSNLQVNTVVQHDQGNGNAAERGKLAIHLACLLREKRKSQPLRSQIKTSAKFHHPLHP